jgi:hypothetical protein
MVIKARTFKIANGLFMYLLNGNSIVHLYPESLMKAAIDPVNVIPPIKVPKKEARL